MGFSYSYNSIYIIFLLSEHILWNERIVIVKKFDFQIFPYLKVLRSPEFIYAIFTVMYMCMCIWVNMIVSKWCICLNKNFACLLQFTVGRTLLILINVGCIAFFSSNTKENSYTLRLVESNSLKCSGIQSMHSIELKFGMYS